MAYVDIDDITIYLPDAGGIDEEALSIFVDEEELFVANRLGVLPADNAIVYSIIRDLVVARSMLTLLPMQSRDVTLATTIRAEALRRLRLAEEDGVGVRSDKRVNTDSVYTPLAEGKPFFTLSDFALEGDGYSTDPQF